MRENVRNFNLAGMGCSAGVVSVDLAKDLLKAHPNSTVVIVSTENITQNWYRSNERVRASAPRREFAKAGKSVDWRHWRISLLAHQQDMIVSNCLFRLGGAAILLSNKRKDARRAKYQLLHTVRVHKVRRRERHHLACSQVDLLTRLSPLSVHSRLSGPLGRGLPVRVPEGGSERRRGCAPVQGYARARCLGLGAAASP